MLVWKYITTIILISLISVPFTGTSPVGYLRKKQHVPINLPNAGNIFTGLFAANSEVQREGQMMRTEDDIIKQTLLPDINELRTQQQYARGQTANLVDTTEEKMFTINQDGEEPDQTVDGSQQIVENFEKTWGRDESMPTVTDKMENKFYKNVPPSQLTITRQHKSGNLKGDTLHENKNQGPGFNDGNDFKDGFYSEKHRYGVQRISKHSQPHDFLNDSIPIKNTQRFSSRHRSQRAGQNTRHVQQRHDTSGRNKDGSPYSDALNEALNSAEQGVELPGDLPHLKSDSEGGVPGKIGIIRTEPTDNENNLPLDNQFSSSRESAVPNLLQSMFDSQMPVNDEEDRFTGVETHDGHSVDNSDTSRL